MSQQLDLTFYVLKQNIKIDEKGIYFEEFPINGLNFVGNLFESSGNIKLWVEIKDDFHLLESEKFQWMQLVNALGTSWKTSIKEEKAN